MPIQIHKDVLDVGFIDRVDKWSRTQEKLSTNLNVWPDGVVGVSGPILLYRLEGELKDELLKQIEDKIPKQIRFESTKFTYTLGSRFSYIPWHDDHCYVFSMTIYLNKIWDRDWAGMFVYEDGDEIKAIYPEFNKAVSFIPPLNHSTCMPNINAPLRQTIQLFFSSEPENQNDA